MNPHSGQMVRLSFVGQPLPRDRESLFYLNFLQVPAVRQTDSDKNKLLLVVTNRLKVFYRPAGLAGDANHVIDRLSLRQPVTRCASTTRPATTPTSAGPRS